MNLRIRSHGLACLSLAAWLLAGCGPRELPKKDTYPVQGKVTLHGLPAAFVIVRLEPAPQTKGVAAEATTKADGTFELRTYSNVDKDGAAPGEYRVVLEEYDPVRSGPLPAGSPKPTKIETQTLETNVTVE